MERTALFLFLYIPLSLYSAHHHPHNPRYGTQGTHSRDHSRGSSSEKSTSEHPDRLEIHIYRDEILSPNPVRPGTPRPRTPEASPIPDQPEIVVDTTLPRTSSGMGTPRTPTTERTKVKLAALSFASTLVGAGLTAIILWKSGCEK